MKFNINKVKENLPIIFLETGIFLMFLALNIIFETVEINDIVKLDSSKTTINKLVINEVIADNEGVYVDDAGNLYDLLELYNGTNNDINLANYGLSDEDNGSIKWAFPDVVIKSKSYLVVYLSGEKNNGLYANFSLKKDGDEIISLKSPTGKVVDALKTMKMPENSSMSRNSKGIWGITYEITPGYENNVNGRQQFLQSFTSKEKKGYPKLAEILPSNQGNVLFGDNSLYGYVEIVNDTLNSIDLHDFYLSNEEEVLYKWRFPNYKLKPNETYLVYMNGMDLNNNASFSLKKKSGKIYLSHKDGIVDTFEYSNLTKGVAYVKKDNVWHQSNNISPGYANTTFGKIEFQKEHDVAKASLVINEAMSSNSKYLVQNGNQYYDWIELYNNSNHDVLLSDYTLATDSDDSDMYKLPNVVLKSKDYYVLMASGNTTLSNKNYNHTNFKLSSGEGLFLYNDDKLVDSMFIYKIPKDNSYGRDKSYGHYYYSTPTPGKDNGSNGIREIAYEPIFNYDGGIYNNVSQLAVELIGTGDIYYTLDGSNPTNSSKKYTGPIVLKNTSVVKAVSYEEGMKTSDIVTNSYIINENHTLPVMSISLKQQDYNYLMERVYTERVVNAHVELYEEDSSFSTSCGLKIFGGQSRELDKKSFSIKFGNKYASTNLKYKVFDEKDIVEFDDLVLRSGSQDQTLSMIRDEFVSKMVVKYGTIIAQDSKPAILYINGKYWGLYYIREKINEKYVEDNYNVLGTTNIVDYLLNTEDGSNKDFLDLKKYIKSHDMTDENNYNYVQQKLDIDSFIDYYVVLFITNNTDLHNVRFYNNTDLDNGKIKVILYDSDYTLIDNFGSNYIDFLIYHYGLNWPPDTTYLEGLLKNSSFRQRFVERISYYMKNVWTEEHVLDVYNYFYNSIKPEMERNANRWNQSYNAWLKEIEKLKSNALSRINIIPEATKEYFKLSEEEFYEYFKS